MKHNKRIKEWDKINLLLGRNMIHNNCVNQSRLKAVNKQSLEIKFDIWGHKGLIILRANSTLNDKKPGFDKYRILNKK